MAAGVPSLDKAEEIISKLLAAGCRHIAFKPGTHRCGRQALSVLLCTVCAARVLGPHSRVRAQALSTLSDKSLRSLRRTRTRRSSYRWVRMCMLSSAARRASLSAERTTEKSCRRQGCEYTYTHAQCGMGWPQRPSVGAAIDTVGRRLVGAVDGRSWWRTPLV